MKKLILFFLCFFATNAYASSADSGICPWPIPFTLSIHAIGELNAYGEFIPTHGPTQYTSSPATPDSEDFSITIDTSNSSSDYSLRKDTLRYGFSVVDTTWNTSQWLSVTITFAAGKDSIIGISINGGENNNFPGEVSSDSYIIQISAMLFDDSSIYSFDSTFKGHNMYIENYGTTSEPLDPGYGTFGSFDTQDFTATSAVLSGIFRPAAFKDPLSGCCPWKLPFKINLLAYGINKGVYPTDSLNLSINVWKCSFNGPDTLYFSSGGEQGSIGSQTSYDSSLTIAFVSGEDSIRTLVFSMGDNYTLNWNNEQASGTDAIMFSISYLAYNDTAIFTADSSFCNHDISATSYSTYNQNNHNTITQNFTASSAYLSGLFQPKDYICIESIVESPSSNGLTINNSNGSIACSFDVSDQARNVEIFSPLGIREASFTILPGQTEASLPHLPDGFYFVRLGGSLAKIYVAE